MSCQPVEDVSSLHDSEGVGKVHVLESAGEEEWSGRDGDDADDRGDADGCRGDVSIDADVGQRGARE